MSLAALAMFAVGAALTGISVALKRADERARRWVEETHEGLDDDDA
jgi:hypothetical protein